MLTNSGRLTKYCVTTVYMCFNEVATLDRAKAPRLYVQICLFFFCDDVSV